MTVPKKPVFVIFLFFLILGLAGYLWFQSLPGTKNTNPLQRLDQKDLSKIVVTGPTTQLTLERENDRWMLTDPLRDITDPSVVDRFMGTLQTFSIGSIVSESETRYPQFQLDEANRKRLRVYAKESDEPLLDGYFGKRSAVGYGSLYFRFENGVPVYLVENFPSFYLQRQALDYRERKALPYNFEQVRKIDCSWSNRSLTLTRSSPTWTSSRKKKPAAPEEWIKNLDTQMARLRANSFLSPEQAAGLDLSWTKPYMRVMVEEEGVTYGVSIGALQDKKAEEKFRYAKVDNREALLLIREPMVRDLFDHLQSY